MKPSQFVADAIRTESCPESLVLSKGGTLALLNLLISTADVADTCKRAVFYGKPLAKDKLVAELNEVASLALTLRNLVVNGNLDTQEDTPTQLSEPNLRLMHGSVGIYSEAGELMHALRQQMITGKLDMVNVNEELGDVHWYGAIITDETGVKMEQTWHTVIEKLKMRFGHKFTSDAAHNRDLDAEREVLEAAVADAK